MSRANLVITRAGPSSLHRQWLAPADKRNFDVLVAAYADIPADEGHDGVTHLHLPGFKVAGWKTIFERQPDLLTRYRNIALIDDDIACDAAAPSACFDAGDRHGLALWQPALTWDSHFTYAGTLANPHMALRYVSTVEMMCPFFTSEALHAALPLFAMGWESGIDLVWCSLLPDPWVRSAIVDAVAVPHTRPVGSEKDRNGFVNSRYEDAINACLTHFRMKWPSLIAYAGIDRDGGRHGQLGVTLRSLGLLKAVGRSPADNALRRVLDHLRHQATRKPWFNQGARNMI